MKHFHIVKQNAKYQGYLPPTDQIAEILGTDQQGDDVLFIVSYHAERRTGYTLPDDVAHKIRTNRGVLVIDYTLETMMEDSSVYGANARQQDLENIRNTTRAYDLPSDRVIVLTGNLKLSPQPEFRVVPVCIWQLSAPSIDFQLKHEIVKDIAQRSPRPYKYMCLMRRPGDARVTFAYEAFKQGFRDQGLVTSWFNPTHGHPFYYSKERVEHWSHRLGQPNDPHTVNDFYASLPWMWDYDSGDEIENNPNCITQGNQYWLFRNSYLNVVHETFFYYQPNQLFLSEKSFKSFIMLQPFVIFGHPGTLEWMRAQGYTTFGDWWDESYDHTTDDARRFQKVLDIVKWISEQSTSYLNDMLIDQLYVLQENHRIYTGKNKTGRADVWHLLKNEIISRLD